MAKQGNSTLIESTLLLALMGLIAGAVGGLAVGLVTGPKAASSATSTK
jgi:hypothetical protein